MADGLLQLRTWLGLMLGWDRRNHTRRIPGCAETSVSERLTDADRRINRADQVHLVWHPVVDFKVVYFFTDELLIELSNETVHALLHLGWVDAPGQPSFKTPQMAIYVKSRGVRTDAYLALIKPFRHTIVYPAWICRIIDEWNRRVRSRRS